MERPNKIRIKSMCNYQAIYRIVSSFNVTIKTNVKIIWQRMERNMEGEMEKKNISRYRGQETKLSSHCP